MAARGLSDARASETGISERGRSGAAIILYHSGTTSHAKQGAQALCAAFDDAQKQIANQLFRGPVGMLERI
jgi:hypothetical protein